MIPGLSSVLRRDKERQRAAGQDSATSPVSSHSVPLPSASSLQREGSIGSNASSSAMPPITAKSPSPRLIQHPVHIQQQSSQQQEQHTGSSRGASQYGMLPEEHRARERERLARAQLSNAHTTQVMANRQLQQRLTPPRQQQFQSSGQGGRYSSQHMESSVTRLLVATKMLLESLTKWSLGQKTETQVSDIYVRLGNDFNVANIAFGSYGIDMSDLHSVPEDLRGCLERCLSEDPSPQTLEIHLPQIREIIIGLLQGLKAKQAEYKQYLVQSRANARQSRTRNERIGTSEEVPATIITSPSSTDTSDSVKRASSLGNPLTQQPLDKEVERKSILIQGNRRPTQAPPLDLYPDRSASPSGSSRKPAGARQPYNSSLRSGAGSDAEAEVDTSKSLNGDNLRKSGSSRSSKSTFGERGPTSPTATKSTEGHRLVADNVERHSLVDPGSSLGDIDEARTPTMATTSFPKMSTSSRDANQSLMSSTSQASMQHAGSFYGEDAVGEMGDAADPSVRALKSRDALERRASKRFSAYTFNKMGVGLNQGMGMSSFALSGLGGGGSNSAASSPLMDRKEGKLGRGSRSGTIRGSSETPESVRDYYSPINRKGQKASLLSSEDVLEESQSGESIAETPSKRPSSVRSLSKSSVSESPRGGNALRLIPTPGSITSPTTAASSTDSLPFEDARSYAPSSSHEGVLSPDSKSDATIGPEFAVPPVPPLPSKEERAGIDALQVNRSSSSSTNTNKYPNTSPVRQPTNLSNASSNVSLQQVTNGNRIYTNGNAVSTTSISLFLQLGRQTRKASVDIEPGAPVKGLNIGKLRMLFMDKFSYSPGKEDFPAIYLKDNASGVTYELEDLDDVGEGSILTLNIEPLDQVKQHLDLSLSGISREIRELKSAIYERDATRKLSAASKYQPADNLASSSPPATKISDAQFAMAGVKVAQYKRATMLPNFVEGTNVPSTPLMSPSTNSTSAEEKSSSVSNWRMAGDQIKQQYDEVQKLRRQVAIINQIHSEYKAEVGDLIGILREQTSKVRSIAASEVPTERNFIIAGKARLDASSQEILTLVEDLLDGVDDLRNDVIQRGVKPKPNTMKELQADIARATKGLEDLSTYVATVKPSWKKTWELELQNIVDEQEFLNHQEGLINDLQEDHYSLQEVFQNIQEVVKLRGANKFTMTGGGNGSTSDAFLGGVALRQYVPPPPEEGHEGLSTVMMEVKTQSVDHEKRLKALQAAERQRQKELSQRKGKDDEFQNELTTFVDGRVLRKTGGYQETERVRSRRDKLTIQAMFSGGANQVGGAPIESRGTITGAPPTAPPRRLQGSDAGEEESSGSH